MFHELSIPATMKAMAHGRTRVRVEEAFGFFSSRTSDEVRELAELRSSLLLHLTACRVSRRLLDAIVLQLVLLCTLLGYRMVRADEESGIPEREIRILSCRGTVPVVSGILSGTPVPPAVSRALLPR
jgi:hypothetical protein